MNQLCYAAQFAVALTLALPAAAQYWISVGSYRDPETAQAGIQALTRLVTEPLAITKYDAAGVYRIVMGPYSHIDGARQALSGVRAQAVPDAWIVTESGAAQTQSTQPPASGWTETASHSSVDIDALLRMARAPLPDSTAAGAEQSLAPEPPVEPVTTIPDGYQLHKLRRAESE